VIYADDPEAAGHRLLADVLAEGARAELVPLMWTLAETGKLTGHTHQDGDDTPEQVREALQGSVRLLGLGPLHQSRGPHGPMLTASSTRRVGRKRVGLEVRADLLDDAAEE